MERDNPTNAKHYNYLCTEIRRRCKQDKNDYVRGFVNECTGHTCSKRLWKFLKSSEISPAIRQPESTL